MTDKLLTCPARKPACSPCSHEHPHEVTPLCHTTGHFGNCPDDCVPASEGDPEAVPSESALQAWLDNECEGAVKMDGYDDCIIGAVESAEAGVRLLYDQELVIEKLMKSGSSREDAVEWYEFNMLGSHMGVTTPVFLFSRAPGKDFR